ncbi:MAG: hypothetical protein SGILL_004061 [Bacillariaceae sp.]
MNAYPSLVYRCSLWISAALLLLTVSSIMMGSGSYNGTSSVIAFSSLILVTYASFVYFRRVKLLRSGDAYGYLDFVGPTILALGVGLGVFIVFADAIKGSEFLPWGGSESDNKYGSSGGHRRALRQTPETAQVVESIMHLQEVKGQCSKYNIDGINMLEYQPRDIAMSARNDLIVATPQALVSHSLHVEAAHSTILSEVADIEITSLAMISDRLFALSTGPAAAEIVEFHSDNSIKSRYLIHDAPSTAGSMVIVGDKFYVYLEGEMHSYSVPSEHDTTLVRTGSLNMKVLNHGMRDSEDPIAAMTHFEGLTYVLRERRNTIETWDLTRATMVSAMTLPAVSTSDKWVGMAFERTTSEKSALRKNPKSSLYLHMPLDTYPSQLWSFRLGEENESFTFPECESVAMN